MNSSVLVLWTLDSFRKLSNRDVQVPKKKIIYKKLYKKDSQNNLNLTVQYFRCQNKQSKLLKIIYISQDVSSGINSKSWKVSWGL